MDLHVWRQKQVAGFSNERSGPTISWLIAQVLQQILYRIRQQWGHYYTQNNE